MSEASTDIPLIRSIFHPSDFGEGSESAFAHALAIALIRQTEFTVFHTATSEISVDGWGQYPAIRGTLERWGLLPKNSPRTAVFDQFGIKAQKVGIQTRQTTAAVAEFLEEHPTDLIVLATRGGEGMPRWIERSVAERLARKTRTMTLFVPRGAKGFVSYDSGDISLQKIVVAVDHDPNPGAAIAFASRAARALGDGTVEIALVHVGQEGAFPAVEVEQDPMLSFVEVVRQGDVVDAVLDEAKARSADLIVMTTQGHQGFLDALRGSTTEQVVRRAKCPLLAVPGYEDA